MTPIIVYVFKQISETLKLRVTQKWIFIILAPPLKKIPLVTAVDPRGKKEIQIITNTCITHSSDLVLL